MKEKQEIVLSYHVKGLKKSEIQSKTALNWRTVDKYIREYEYEREKLISLEGTTSVPDIIEEIVKPPQYDSSNRTKRKVNEALIEEVRVCLKKNEEHRNSGRHKQQMKKIDIHEHLVKSGFDVGLTTVCTVINEEIKKKAEAFVRQKYAPGYTCEFDWGEVKLVINGRKRRFYMAVFTAAYSNYRFAVLFEHENTQAFQTSHAIFFSHIGGSYKEMLYDNMRVAVKRFVGHEEKEATDGLLKLSLYYLFNFRFCNVAKGNEKGHVERSVEYIRRKAFSGVCEFDTLEAANEHLLSVVSRLNGKAQSQHDGKSADDLFIDEISFLSDDLPPFECAELTSCRVDKYSTISLFQNRYSVPDHCVGKMVDVKIYADKIMLYDDQEKLCEHTRSYERQTWTLSLDHYLYTLLRKPGALSGSSALAQAETEVRHLYKEWFVGEEKEFVELLIYMKTEGISHQHVLKSIEKIVRSGSRSINKDSIKMILSGNNSVPDRGNYHGEIESVSRAQLEEYDRLFGAVSMHPRGGAS